MLILKHLLVITFLIYCVSGNELNASVHYQPEQVHLSFGENLRTIVVTWSTKKNTKNSFCEYRSGSDGTKMSVANETSSNLFTDGGRLKKTQIIHRATLENLIPNATYVYRCGSDLGWSDNFGFHVPPESADWVPSLAIYGDTDAGEKSIIGELAKEVRNGTYDAILHLGDFAYDLHSNNGEGGNKFMNKIQPVAAKVPYMTCVGNHEFSYNFSHYRARFSMPGGTENLYYSFDMGPIHFIGFSTEIYYFLQYGSEMLVKQFEWLENDLKEANKPENRALRPWIITFGHRPMYCSNVGDDDCASRNNRIRLGVRFGKKRKYGLEKLFYDYGVDVELWSHQHCYERLWPIYNNVLYKGSAEEPYRNPKAPVHITIGTGGSSFGVDFFRKNKPKWSAVRSKSLGYTHLKAFNKTHLFFEHKSKDRDAFWLIKDHHGPYES